MKTDTATHNGAQRRFSHKQLQTCGGPQHDSVQAFADIAHALQTPLTCIMGELSLLEKNTPRHARGHVQKSLRVIRNMSALIHNALYMARLGASDFTPLMERVSLTEMVTTIIDDVTTLTARRKINVTASVQKNIVVSGVPNKLEELIIAILSNAIKYCKPRGKREIDVALYANSRSAVVQIRDNGIGIAPEELPHIFNRFYRTKNGTRQSDRGTGLGLAIAKTIAEKHKVTLSIQSTLGKGTCVRITFPLKRR